MTKLDARWFERAKWGVFIHFLADGYIKYDDSDDGKLWNAAVNSFDVETLAEQLRDVSAGYLFLTIGQNTGYYCSPNETYDKLVAPGFCSERDLMADLATALKRFDIPLIAYFTSGAPDKNPQALSKLGWRPADRSASFQRKWEEIVAEWSSRWGEDVAGWWIDGCYFADEMYRHPEPPNFKSFAAAMRAGNPRSILAWNPGVAYPPVPMDSEEDYTAGETNEPQSIDAARDLRAAGDEQLHYLSYLGRTWGNSEMRFSPEELILHTREATDHGGVFSWDAPINPDGTLTDEAFDILRPLGKTIDEIRDVAVSPPVKRCGVELSFTEVPTSEKSGSATVSVSNEWDVPLAGEITVEVLDERRGLEAPPVEIGFDLPPGTSKERSFEIASSDESDRGSNRIVVIRSADNPRALKFPVPRRFVLRPPSIAETPTIHNAARVMGEVETLPIVTNGRLLADVKIAICDDELVLFLNVNDMSMIRSPALWQGSCLEIFGFSPNDGSIKQLFALPKTENGDEDSLRCLAMDIPHRKGEFPTKPFEMGTFRTRRRQGGYDAMLKVPFREWLKLPADANEFLFDLICDIPEGNSLLRGALGSDRAAQSSENYLAIEI